MYKRSNTLPLFSEMMAVPPPFEGVDGDGNEGDGDEEEYENER